MNGNYVVNDAGRRIPKYIDGFGYTIPYRNRHREIEVLREKTEKNFKYVKTENKILPSIREAIQKCDLKDGMIISFHHHLRDGDYIINMVLEEIARLGIKDLTIAASSLQKVHEPMIEHIKNGVITGIRTSGMRGALAKEISYNNILKKPVIFQTHGGRARSIEMGEMKIDVAFIAASSCDKMGNMSGRTGKSAFGSMGYAMTDAKYADKVVAITDNLVEYPLRNQSIDQTLVDYVVVVDEIGDVDKIATGATRVTQNPKELLMAQYAARVINASGYMKDGFSFQAGSGGASLAVIRFLKEYMKEKGIKGGTISGGITSVLVEMLEEGYFEALLDAQTFDAGAVDSFNRNINHIEMSASMYANPYSKGCVANMLDIMVLSATEVDVNFNVNVLTGSDGIIIGAQGGHPDTAEGAKLRIVTAPITRKNIPIIRDKVTTVVTPGCNVDIVVTDKGIAINPRRPDLSEKLRNKDLPIKDIYELKYEAERMVGKPSEPVFGEEIVGIVEARDGSVMDVVRRVIGSNFSR